MPLSHLFLVIMIASLFSFGGLGSLPVLENQLSSNWRVARRSRVARLGRWKHQPWPQRLYLIAASYFIGGVTGSLVACLAVVVPPLSGRRRRTGTAAIDSPAPVPGHVAIAGACGRGAVGDHRLVTG